MKTAIYCRVSTEVRNRTEQACKHSLKPVRSIARIKAMKSFNNLVKPGLAYLWNVLSWTIAGTCTYR
jgi:hypothetical protein